MKIRIMELQDITPVTAGEIKMLGKTLGRSFLENELANPSAFFLVAETGEKVIGYIGAYINEPAADMINFYIEKECQHQGFGQQLYNRLEEECIKRNAHIITLEVKEENIPATAFYFKNGFRKVNIRNEYYEDGSNAILMQKVIK